MNESAVQPQGREKASPKLLFGYGLGEVACQMSWYMINNYLNIFYTDVVGLSGAAISAIVLVARIWDAINDPMMGQIADRTHTRWGKFRPYLMFAPPFLAIFNILTFTVFPVQGAAKVILCGVCYIAAGMAYTACSIAYQAMLNVIAVDSRVRQLLATARSTGASIIGIILSMVAMPLILRFSSAVNENGERMADGHGYFVATVIFSILLIPIFWACAALCKETYTDKLHAPANGGQAEKTSFLSNMKGLVQNDQLLIVVIATVLGTICVTGRYGILVYHVIYVVGGPQYIATMFTAMTVGQLVGTLTVPWGTKAFGKRNYMLILNGIMAAGFVALFLNPTNNPVFLIGASFIGSLGFGAPAICYGMVGDSLEYGDWKLGKRQEGLAASMLSFGVKLATAVCAPVVLLLEAVGYVPNMEQTPSTKTGINFMVNMLPAIIAVISCVPLIWYKLSDKRVAELRADLEAGKHAWDK
ncbi:MAG: MFS transporter [Oscillospiraceae bacterium]|nr:MFS transporter [Oscillospiraceae bacterium]